MCILLIHTAAVSCYLKESHWREYDCRKNNALTSIPITTVCKKITVLKESKKKKTNNMKHKLEDEA